jgi:hypothetical protein
MVTLSNEETQKNAMCWSWEKQARVDIFQHVLEMEFWHSRYLFDCPSSYTTMDNRICTLIVTLVLGYKDVRLLDHQT